VDLGRAGPTRTRPGLDLLELFFTCGERGNSILPLVLEGGPNFRGIRPLLTTVVTDMLRGTWLGAGKGNGRKAF